MKAVMMTTKINKYQILDTYVLDQVKKKEKKKKEKKERRKKRRKKINICFITRTHM